MYNLVTSDNGRELAIKFTCRRCRKETYLLYEQAMKCEKDGYIRNSKLPEGWKNIGFMHGVMCEECAAKFDEFMKGNI